MGNYVKVKKAKVLRFKLISVMYLIFISLSMLQIPIDWLRVNINMAEYIGKSTKVEIDDPDIADVFNELSRFEEEFLKEIGYDVVNKKYGELDGYNLTDKYFIRDKKGYALFEKLVKLEKYYESLPADNPKGKEFAGLFENDLVNGLKAGKANIWVEWKFKHVPMGVVVTWLADMKLKMKLLNGGIITTEEQNRDYLVLMAYNIEAVRPGDTVRIVVFNHEEMQVSASQGGQSFELNDWNRDTLLFIPKYVGVYDLSFKKNGVEETLKVTSVAKTFEREKDNKYNIFYQGKTSELHYVNLLNPGQVSCSCDPDATLDRQKSKIVFNPKATGWCYFQINNKEGKLLLKDSVFVQKLPVPFVYAKGVSGDVISRVRLKSDNKLVMYATHPDLQKFNFKLSNLKYRLVGISTEPLTATDNVINIPTDKLESLRYVVIEAADINNEIKNMEFESPLVIQVK